MNLSLVLILLSAAVLIVANIWMIVAGFRVSLLWGLLNLLLSPAQMVFMFVHWTEARKPFFCSLIGLAILVPAIFMNLGALTSPDGLLASSVMAELRKRLPQPPSEPAPEPAITEPTLPEKEAALAQHAGELKQRYDLLQAQWARLAADDRAGRAAFDAEAARYAALRKQIEVEKAALDQLRATAAQ